MDLTFELTEIREPLRVTLNQRDEFSSCIATKDLVYPIEFGALANWGVTPTDPQDAEESDAFGGWPRVDLIPSDGVLFWLLLGDVARDNEIEPWYGGGPLAQTKFEYLAPMGAEPGERVVTQVTDLNGDDWTTSRWASVAAWDRVIPLADRSGEARIAPQFLQIRAFAGESATESPLLTGLLPSIRFEYL